MPTSPRSRSASDPPPGPRRARPPARPSASRSRSFGRRSCDRPAPAQAERHARLLDRAVRLLRGVHHRCADLGPAREPASPPRRAPPPRVPPRSRCSEDVEAVSVSSPSNASGSPRALAQPADDHVLELGADRRRAPQHRVLAEHRRDASRPGCPGREADRREVREEAGVLPVRRVGLAPGAPRRRGSPRSARGLGRLWRQPVAMRAGLDRGQDRELLDALEVVREQVDDLVRGRPELLGAHVGEAADLGGIQALEPGQEPAIAGRHRHARRRSASRSSSVRRAPGRRSPKRA